MKAIASSRGTSLLSGMTLKESDTIESQLRYYKEKATRFVDSNPPSFEGAVTAKDSLLALFYKHKYT